MNSDNRLIESAATTDVETRPNRTRRVRFAGLVIVAALGAAACTSDPSAQRIAKDLVNTLATSDEQRDCMLKKLDDYGKDEIEAIAKSADEVSQNVGEKTPLQQFEDDLASCNTAG